MQPTRNIATAVVAVALTIMVLGAIALFKCPSQEIPAAIEAFGSWLRISIKV